MEGLKKMRSVIYMYVGKKTDYSLTHSLDKESDNCVISNSLRCCGQGQYRPIAKPVFPASHR
jgi:hypothetical protein